MNKEKLERVKAFLEENQFNTNWNSITHKQGIFKDSVTVVPGYNPYDNKYTIAVGLNKVYGYTISTPYNFNYWFRRWEENYSTKEELLKILNRLSEPKNCW
jgi:hypothetical protein